MSKMANAGLIFLFVGMALWTVVLAVGIYQQEGPCTEACAAEGFDCVGTSIPPWGEDMKCYCAEPPISVVLP